MNADREIQDSTAEKAFKMTQPPTPPPRTWHDESGALVISFLPPTPLEATLKKRGLSPPPSPTIGLPPDAVAAQTPLPLPLGALEAHSTSVLGCSPTGSPNLTTMPPLTPHPANTTPAQASSEPTGVVTPAAKRRRRDKQPQPTVEIEQTTSAQVDAPVTEGLAGPGQRMTRQQHRRQVQESTVPPDQGPQASSSKVPVKRKVFEGVDGPGAPGRPGRPKKVRITEVVPEPGPKSQREPEDVGTEAAEKDVETEAGQKDGLVKGKGGRSAGPGRPKAQGGIKGVGQKGATAGMRASARVSGKRKK